MQWGAWAGLGMVAHNAAVHRAMQRSGVGMLQPPQGLAAVQQVVIAGAAAALAVIPFDWQRFMRQPAHAAAFFYAEHRQVLPQQAAEQGLLLLAASAAVANTPGWRHAMPPLSLAEPAAGAAPLPSGEEVLQLVLQALEDVQGGPMGAQQPLVQAGLDSLGAWQCTAAPSSPVADFSWRPIYRLTPAGLGCLTHVGPGSVVIHWTSYRSGSRAALHPAHPPRAYPILRRLPTCRCCGAAHQAAATAGSGAAEHPRFRLPHCRGGGSPLPQLAGSRRLRSCRLRRSRQGGNQP